MDVYMHHVAGSSSYHIRDNMALDKCPKCGQWHSRHPSIVGAWTCAKADCGEKWGDSICDKQVPHTSEKGRPTEGLIEPCGGAIANILHVNEKGESEKQYTVCLKCGVSTNDPKEKTEDADEVLSKLGFNESREMPGTWSMKLATPMMQGFPQGIPPLIQGALLIAPENEQAQKIDVQCGHIMQNCFDLGFTLGMISMLKDGWNQKHVFDNILARVTVGQAISYAGTSWVCTKVHKPHANKKWADWRSSVGDIETRTEKYKPGSWEEIFKPLFDTATAAEEAKQTPAQRQKAAADKADPLESQTDEDLGIGSMSVDELKAVEAGK